MKLQDVRARVRTLAQESKLDKALYKQPDSRLPWPEWFWVNGAMAVVALAILITRAALLSAQTGQRPTVADFLHGLVLLALVGLGFLLAKIVVPPADRRRRRLLHEGVVVPAAILQANSQWRADGNEEWQPGAIVWSLDPKAEQDPDELGEVASVLFKLKHADRRDLPLDQAAIAWDVYHEMGPMRTLPVPAELARGLRDVWYSSAILAPQPISYGDALLILALPGDPAPDAISVLDRSHFGE